MGDVSDEEAFVERFVGGDADAATAGGVFGAVVHTEVAGVAIIGDTSDQTRVRGGGVVVEFNEAISWVGVGEGGEVAEESVAVVVVGEDIACYAAADKQGACEEADERGKIHAGSEYNRVLLL